MSESELTTEERVVELERRFERYVTLNRVVAWLAAVVVVISLIAATAATVVALLLLSKSETVDCRERLAGYVDLATGRFLGDIAKLAEDDPNVDTDDLATAAEDARTAGEARATAVDPCRALDRIERALDSPTERTIP